MTKMIYFAEIEDILLYARCMILRFEQLKNKNALFYTPVAAKAYWLIKLTCVKRLSDAYSSVSIGGSAGSCSS